MELRETDWLTRSILTIQANSSARLRHCLYKNEAPTQELQLAWSHKRNGRR